MDFDTSSVTAEEMPGTGSSNEEGDLAPDWSERGIGKRPAYHMAYIVAFW
ncbi:MAG: hypothetical protein ACYTFA_00325 [Planctomycetota bacterium]